MSMHPSGLIIVANNLSEITRFAFKLVKHKLTPDVQKKFASNIDDLCSSLERAKNHPRMMQDRFEALQEQLLSTWSQLGQNFSDEDNVVVAKELAKYAGIQEFTDYGALFNEILSEHGLASAVAVVPAEPLMEAGVGDASDFGEDAVGVTVTGGTAAAGIGLVTVGNVIGGAASAAGSTAGVVAATAIVKTGAAAVTTATSSAAAIPVVGTTIATGITTAATTAATAGALVGSAAVAAAPVVVPVLAAWWLLRRAFRE